VRFALSGMALASITALAVGVLAMTPTVSASTGSVVEASAKRPTTPSQQPPRPSFTTASSETTTSEATTTTEAASAEATSSTTSTTTVPTSAGLDYNALFTQWATDNHIEGAVAAIAIGHDVIWQGASGTWQDGTPVGENDQFDIASVTKEFTASMVLHYADLGVIDLNAPLPYINVLPTFPYDLNITVKDLLEHRSGLMNYRDTPEYVANPQPFSDAATAVMISASHPLLAAPGTESIYASTNYLILGLLLEQVSGESYDDLLTENILEPLALEHTTHLPPSSGEPRFSTAGIVTDTVDLANAGIGLLRDHVLVSDAGYALMNTIDPASGAGTGSYGYCPCTLAPDGTHQYFGIGYTGSTTIVIYNKAFDMTIALDLTESLWDNGRFDAVTRLFQMIQDQVAAAGRNG
jgi:CubicO group peptidase (beta-lactamase class C family)